MKIKRTHILLIMLLGCIFLAGCGYQSPSDRAEKKKEIREYLMADFPTITFSYPWKMP